MNDVGSILELGSDRLQADRFTLVLLSQDIEHAREHLASEMRAQGVQPEGVTGLLVDAREGDYAEVWVTEWSRPHELATHYTRIV